MPCGGAVRAAVRPVTRDDVATLFARLSAGNPAPATELAYANPFELLVAVVLSAQSTDTGVNRATAGLFAAAGSPAAMVALGEDGIRNHIRTIGLFNTKAKNVLSLSAALLANHEGEVPHDRAALEALPGVGRKTANVVLNEIFGEQTCAVDTHIFRVANRTGLAPGTTPRAVEDALMVVIPAAYRRHAHHWLLLHGRYTCVARKPECWRCIVADLCAYLPKTPAPAATRISTSGSQPVQRRLRMTRG
jgi:endonuclease-3